MTTVAVLGGGVAGLSAAHELAERGFERHGLRAARRARRQGAQHPGHGSGTGGRADLPGRARLPLLPGLLPPPARHDGADPGRRPDRARPPRRRDADPVRAGRRPRTRSSPRPTSRSRADDFAVLARFLREAATQARRAGARVRDPPRAAAHAADQLRRAARRAVGPAELVGLHGRRALAAPRSSASSPTGSRARSSPRAAREMSARTGGAILIQLLQDLTRAGGRADRVLDAPTSEVWIDPWVAAPALARRGRAPAARRSRRCTLAGGRIAGATVAGQRRPGRPLRRRAARRGHAPARLAGAARRRAAAEAGSTGSSRAG